MLETGAITPRDYQWQTYEKTGEHIRKSKEPAFVHASVGAGKTIMIAMICKRCQDVGMSAMVLARQGELIEQNSDELWRLGVKNSIFSASLNKKSTLFPIICGTEGTVARALDGQLDSYAPDFLLIDECITGDALIDTSSGAFRIDDPRLKDQFIKCIDENTGMIYFHKPVRVFSNGIKSVSCFKLSNGYTITCTNTHKLYSNGSWKRAGTLRSGERLALDASQDSVIKKLLRAAAAVVKKLIQHL